MVRGGMLSWHVTKTGLKCESERHMVLKDEFPDKNDLIIRIQKLHSA